MRRIGWLLLLLLTARQTAYAQFAQPTADETLPPVGQAARPFAAPTPYSVTLPNGLRVLVVEKPGSGVVCVQMTVRAGSDKDGERPGLALMTAKLLALGTEKRSPDQIARRIEALGGTMRCRVDRDAAHIQISSLAANTENAVELLSDMVRQPTFLAAEIERRRLQMRDDLTLAIADPSALSQIAIGRLLFGSASYGSPTQGTPEGIAKIMKDDLIRFHLAAYRPDRATLIVAGDVAPGEVFNFAKRYWADWKSNGRVPALPESEAPTPTLPRRFLILDTPDAAKAAILVARNIPRPDEPDFSRGMTALSALNRFGGRLAGEFGGSTIIARRGFLLGTFRNRARCRRCRDCAAAVVAHGFAFGGCPQSRRTRKRKGRRPLRQDGAVGDGGIPCRPLRRHGSHAPSPNAVEHAYSRHAVGRRGGNPGYRAENASRRMPLRFSSSGTCRNSCPN